MASGITLLRLSGAEPVATGHLRQVFQHPLQADLLVKVMRADVIESRWGPAARWYKRRTRARHYTGHVRELKEYIASQVRARDGSVPISRMVGITDTDLGLGLVSEKVRGPDGGLAPTLAAVYVQERGFSDHVESGLARFLSELLEYDVIVGDMHAWNIVYGIDSRGGPRFVLVDGFGEKHVLPRSSMSRRLNAWNTRKLFRRMRAQLVRLVPLGDAPP